MRTGGEVPGLALFEEDSDTPGLWEGIKQLFVGRARIAEGVGEEGVLEDRDEYDDYSGAGWDGNEGHDDLDDIDDMVENMVILGITGLIMLLFWLRQRWGQLGRPQQAQAQAQAQWAAAQ